MNYRVFVEKKPQFSLEAAQLRDELNENLGLSIRSLRLVNVYDLFGFDDALIAKTAYGVFGEKVTDEVTVTEGKVPSFGRNAVLLASEYLPGQFDQRAASAEACVKLVDPKASVRIKSARLLSMQGDLDEAALEKIRHYMINPVESREKNLAVLSDTEYAPVKPVPVLEGFREMEDGQLAAFCKKMGLAMNADDLRTAREYFTKEGRDPNETELRILDTYWSDHCRHTTFTTELQDIRVEESFIKEDIDGSLHLWLKMRQDLGRGDKALCLMDLATIGAKYLRAKGLLDDMEVSEENNACSIYVDVDEDGVTERWLLMFKNETHNHPTEIEPFGGAATCLGGAIRDPLSGRAYVYQAMRITGAGDIWKDVADTLPGKLPQKMISKRAAQGYSSYGNQIGLATTMVHEIVHPGYTAKRMEIGAVAGAVKAANVRRERPAPGDVILLLGGRTGRDGIGGATGASKEHDESSLETCGSEVQKGNAPEERKLQRLFRRPEVTRLIKKSNDFGAGGVSVAIGELADGLDIWLDRVPVKYSGLNSTELAISESQERMAVVVEGRDEAEFRSYCRQENVEVTHVAEVTDTGRMRMYNGGRMVVDLERGFIDSAGARHHAEAEISAVPEKDPFLPEKSDKALKDRILDLIRRPDVCSQKGLIEMFDSTVGRSTVLMPLGGRLQATEAQVSVQKLPTDGYTDTASMMAWGFDPYLSEWSPYHGAAYAVVDACTKVAAAGGDASRMRFSYQEYFERMGAPSTWGKPLAALLGALKMQEAFGLPAIGGKDSMSGSFEDRLHVPPTLVAIGITTVKASEVISPEFKEEGHGIWLLEHKPLGNHMPDTEALLRNWKLVKDEVHSGNVVAAFAAGAGGVAEAVCKMAFGNGLGAEVETGEGKLLCIAPGSIVMEAVGDVPGAVRIGTVKKGTINLNGVSFSTSSLLAANEEPWSRIYPIKSRPDFNGVPALRSGRNMSVRYRGARIEHPLVYLPVFPGTNCDYDTAKAFRAAGARTRFGVFCNQSEEDIRRSLKDMAAALAECQILALSGGFSAGDEPDGSGKFIADILCNKEISAAIRKLLERGGLILGICNGFQALVKSGLLPYGEAVSEDSPTLFRNDVGRHVSRVVTTRVASLCSPWLRGFSLGQEHTIAISHGEGKFMVRKDLAEKLLRDGQVAFQYADADGGATMQSPDNPNGSYCAIEGIVSANGQILGKMGHSERWEQGLLKNIPGDKRQPIFENAVNYFRGE